MDGMRNLYNLQYFSDIIPDVVPGSEDDLMNIVFNVEEQSTTSIEGRNNFFWTCKPKYFSNIINWYMERY